MSVANASHEERPLMAVGAGERHQNVALYFVRLHTKVIRWRIRPEVGYLQVARAEAIHPFDRKMLRQIERESRLGSASIGKLRVERSPVYHKRSVRLYHRAYAR